MSYFDDYMSDGTCCASCGEYIDAGVITTCDSCKKAQKEENK